MQYVVVDFETTGLNFMTEQVIEVAAIKLNDEFEEIGSFHTLVELDRGRKLPEFITRLTGLSANDLTSGMQECQAFDMLESFISGSTVVAQFAPFDLAFMSRSGIEPFHFICTKSLTLQAEPNENSSLVPTCERLGIELENAHRAIDDARATGRLLAIRMKQDLPHVYNTIQVIEGRPFNFIPRRTDYIINKDGELIADLKVSFE